MNSTSIFANCSKHYAIEPLLEFCVNVTNPCEAVLNLETAIIIIYVDYYLSTVLFSIAILLNAYCLVVASPMFFRMQEDSRKKYVFLLSRSTASLFSSIAWLLVQCIYIRFIPPTPDNFPFYVIALSLYDASIYGMLGSYVGMSLILYIGVLYPTTFQQKVRLRYLYGSINIIFVVAFALSIPVATFQAAIAIPGTLNCTKTNCAPLVSLINFVLVFGSLLITVSILAFVLFSIHRHRKELEKTETLSNSSLNSAFRLLSWTFLAIILVVLAEVLPFAISESKGENKIEQSLCQSFYHSSAPVIEASLTTFECVVWSVALIIDPLANILFDKTLSRQAIGQIRWLSSKLSRTSSERSEVCQRHTTASQDGGSEVEQ